MFAEPHHVNQSELTARPSAYPVHRCGLSLEQGRLDSHHLFLRGHLALAAEAI
jgi:hypothetical protein